MVLGLDAPLVPWRRCSCAGVLPGPHGEAAHVLGQPGVELRVGRLPAFDQIGRLGPPALSPLRLDLSLHLPPHLGTESRLVDLAGEEEEKKKKRSPKLQSHMAASVVSAGV